MDRVGYKWAVAVCALLAGIVISMNCKRSTSADEAPAYGPAPATQATARAYTFGLVPLRNPARLVELYQPLVDELNRPAGHVPVRLVLSRDHAAFEASLRSGTFALALVNAGQAVRFESCGYRIFGKASDDSCGVILVRKDSDIRQVSDLRGRRISFPAATAIISTGACKMFLYDHGLNVDRDAMAIYTSSYDSAILNVFQGQTDAAGALRLAWEQTERDRPDIAAALEVRWQTEPMLPLALVARANLPPADLQNMCHVLFHLQDTPRGRAILSGINMPSFVPATNQTYEPMRQFLARCEQVFGRID